MSDEETQCPVCGYYCLGNGGNGCIDKPTMLRVEEESRSAKLRIAYVGDYPGEPHVWMNGEYCNENEVFFLLELFGIFGGNEFSRLRRLLDLLGAKKNGEEHEEWIGSIHINAVKHRNE